MASTIEYIEDLCQKVAPVGAIRSRKMFGDWMVYIDEKPAITVCDNQAYIKILPQIAHLMTDAETGSPYPGAKEHYILDTDHVRQTIEVLRTLVPLLPYPAKKKKKEK